MATPSMKTYRAVIGFLDHAGKVSHSSFYISAADFTAWGTDTTAGNVRSVMDKIEALSLDNVQSEEADEDSLAITAPVVPPVSEDAVNSAKLLVLFTDLVTLEKYSMTIPARDATTFISDRGFVRLTTAGGGTSQIQDFVTAFEAHALSEDGNGVKVRQIRVVGRGTAA